MPLPLPLSPGLGPGISPGPGPVPGCPCLVLLPSLYVLGTCWTAPAGNAVVM